MLPEGAHQSRAERPTALALARGANRVMVSLDPAMRVRQAQGNLPPSVRMVPRAQFQRAAQAEWCDEPDGNGFAAGGAPPNRSRHPGATRFPVLYPFVWCRSEGETTKEGIPDGGHGVFSVMTGLTLARGQSYSQFRSRLRCLCRRQDGAATNLGNMRAALDAVPSRGVARPQPSEHRLAARGDSREESTDGLPHWP